MQTQTPVLPDARPRTTSWAPRRAEFRFTSDAALERALALLGAQPWIGACSVDRARRTLRVSLSAGTASAVPTLETPPALH